MGSGASDDGTSVKIKEAFQEEFAEVIKAIVPEFLMTLQDQYSRDGDANNAPVPSVRSATIAPFCKSSAKISFLQFCNENQLEVDSALAEFVEGCSACVSASEPGEPIVWVNDEFVEMVGWAREEVLGKPCKFLQGEKTTQESRAECRRLITSQTEGLVSLVNYTKQGTEFENALYLRPLYSQGQCRFFLGTQLDLRSLVRFCRHVSFCDEIEIVTFYEPSPAGSPVARFRADSTDSMESMDLSPHSPMSPSASFFQPSAQVSFHQFCFQNQLEVENGLADLLDGCSACVSSNEPGEPIVWVNDEFAEMTGWQRHEILGKPCKFLQGEKTTRESRAEVRRLIESQEEGFVSLVNYTKAGKEFDNALYIRPLHNKEQCRFFLGSQLDLRGSMRFLAQKQARSESKRGKRSATAHVDSDPSSTVLVVPSRSSLWKRRQSQGSNSSDNSSLASLEATPLPGMKLQLVK